MKEGSNIHKDRFDDFAETQESSGRPFSRIFQEIVGHVSEIIRSEIRLARAEVREDVTYIAKASVFLVMGSVLGLYALGFILLAVVYALGAVVAAWLAAAIVGIGIGIVAAIFLQIGRTKLEQANLKPNKTIRSLQENVTWMKKQTK